MLPPLKSHQTGKGGHLCPPAKRVTPLLIGSDLTYGYCENVYAGLESDILNLSLPTMTLNHPTVNLGLDTKGEGGSAKDWNGRRDSNPRRPAWKVSGSKRCGTPNGQGSESRPVIYSSNALNCPIAPIDVTICR